MRYFCLLLALLLHHLPSEASTVPPPSSPPPPPSSSYYPLVPIRLKIREIDSKVTNRIAFTQNDEKKFFYVEGSLKPKDLISLYDKGKEHSSDNQVDRLKSIAFINKATNAEVELTKDEKEGDSDFITLYNEKKKNKSLDKTIDSADELRKTMDVYPCYVSSETNGIDKYDPMKVKDASGNDIFPDGKNEYSFLIQSEAADIMEGIDLSIIDKEYEEPVDEVTTSPITDPTREDRAFHTFLIENYKLMLTIMLTIGSLLFLGVYLLPSPPPSNEEETSTPKRREGRRKRSSSINER